MRAVIQRVGQARVRVDAEVVGEIGMGLLALVGVEAADTSADAEALAAKIVRLRIFEDEAGLMNRSLQDVGGALLVVSQFTLMADCSKGRRPSFGRAAPPEHAEPLVETLVASARGLGVTVDTGRFGAMMAVSLVNQGPVTLLIDTQRSI